jgi:hypothetical protein
MVMSIYPAILEAEAAESSATAAAYLTRVTALESKAGVEAGEAQPAPRAVEGEVFVDAECAKLFDCLSPFLGRSSFSSGGSTRCFSARLVREAFSLRCVSSRDSSGILTALSFGFGCDCSSGCSGCSALGLNPTLSFSKLRNSLCFSRGCIEGKLGQRPSESEQRGLV